MINTSTESLRYTAIQFLEQNPAKRLQILQALGMGRYDFLTKMRLNEANITCIMRFFQKSKSAKISEFGRGRFIWFNFR